MNDSERARPYALLVLAMVAVAVLIHAMHKCGDLRARNAPSVTLESKHARFTLFRDGRIRVETSDGARSVEGEIVASADDAVEPITMPDLANDGVTRARARTKDDREMTFTVDAAHDALDVTVRGGADSATESGDPGVEHGVGVRLPTEGREVFLSGRGELADLTAESGRFAVLSDAAHPIGFVAAGKPMRVALAPRSEDAHAMEVRVTVPPEDARFTIAVGGARRGSPWAVLFDRAHVETKRVKGFVTGAPGATHVVGLDDQGAQQMRLATDVAGRFDFRAPAFVTSWYASASATRTSAPVIHAPGTPWDLQLDVSDGGELHVRVLDADTNEPITARLLVHGIDGTLDPSFGPDYRASGAGPIIDALRGEVTTPLPAGKYRVAVTKGIEWSIDSRVVAIAPGKRVDLDLAPRHVVPTPDELGCDLHVHARPSFDSPVSPEDRVLSLVAAGIDFAVPTEHNLVGDYGPSLAMLGLEGELMFVPGVEITTYSPRFGHFGIFPYPQGKGVPAFRHTNVGAVFASARGGDPKRVLVVHHPRLARDIGYFTAFGWKAGTPPPARIRLDFDALEVFNGYESASLERVENVLRDYWALLDAGHRYAITGSSDSHRIQYQWAGYPRTMVRVDGKRSGRDRRRDQSRPRHRHERTDRRLRPRGGAPRRRRQREGARAVRPFGRARSALGGRHDGGHRRRRARRDARAGEDRSDDRRSVASDDHRTGDRPARGGSGAHGPARHGREGRPRRLDRRRRRYLGDGRRPRQADPRRHSALHADSAVRRDEPHLRTPVTPTRVRRCGSVWLAQMGFDGTVQSDVAMTRATDYFGSHRAGVTTASD